MMNKMFARCVVVMLCFFGVMTTLTGCSVIMAMRQPSYKDTKVLEKGTPRARVISELGAPTLSEVRNGKKVDVFSFTQGYGKGNKALRAFFYAAADFWTLFLWEIIGTPAEIIASGKKMKLEIIYDQNDTVEQVNNLSIPK